MKTAQILIWEPNTRLATMLEHFAVEMSWLVRRARDVAHAVETLQSGGAGVLLIEWNDQSTAALELLAACAEYDWPMIVVGHDLKRDLAYRRQWMGLLYDLGATLTLFPPLAKATLEDAVAGLMEATIRRFGERES